MPNSILRNIPQIHHTQNHEHFLDDGSAFESGACFPRNSGNTNTMSMGDDNSTLTPLHTFAVSPFRGMPCASQPQQSYLNILSAVETTSNMSQDEFKYTLREIIGTRAKSVGLRVDLQNLRNNHQNQRDWFLQKQEEWARASDTSERDKVHKELKSLDEVLRKIEEQMRKEEKELTALEFEIEEMERRLYASVAGPGPNAFPNFNESLTDASLPPPSNSNTKSSDSKPSILKEYYNSVGDVQIFHDRLYSFEMEYDRALRDRELRTSLGKSLDPPDRVFYREYFDEREKLLQEYSTEKAKAERLELQCAEQGITFQRRAPVNVGASIRLDLSRRIHREPADLEVLMPRQSWETPIFKSAETKRLVLCWLDQLPAFPIEPLKSNHPPTIHHETGPEPSDRLPPPSQLNIRSRSSSRDCKQGIVSTETSNTPPTVSEKFPYQDPPIRRYSNPHIYTYIDEKARILNLCAKSTV